MEAHGTGTPVGDDVELRALAEVWGDGDQEERSRPLLIGSVKTNIGHAEAAAGIAGLIKTALIARHRTIPASLHLRTPHPVLAGGGAPSNASRATPRSCPAAGPRSWASVPSASPVPTRM